MTLREGDCLEILKTLADNSVDAVVTDPPYHLTSAAGRSNLERDDSTLQLPTNKGGGGTTSPYKRAATGFMGKTWDGGDIAQNPALWSEVLRVLKPGGHCVAFSGTRTYHRMACAIEDAGFEVRDQLAWTYGQGFPKSHDVSKGIDKAAGAEREVVGVSPHSANRGQAGGSTTFIGQSEPERLITAPATDAARQWEGWGTALKPSYEPIMFGSKPLKVGQHIAILVQELTLIILEAAQWSNCNAPNAERSFRDILAKCEEASISVLDSARIRSLESIGIAKSAARSSISNALASIDLIRTKDCSALSHVAQFGKQDATPDQTTEVGTAVDILTRLMAISTSVMMEGMSESIVSSWLNISDDLLSASSKFTTSTASKLTIALRTLNYSMSPSISADTGRLTPNWEPICLARKPLSEKTVAANVLRWGTGALNIDATRIGTEARVNGSASSNDIYGQFRGAETDGRAAVGRWPANLCHDGSQEVLDLFPETKSGHAPARGKGNPFGGVNDTEREEINFNDNGSAARFFYCAKASKADRSGSSHPTVKPIKLMQWLCRLVCPPGGVVLDPFAGSGTTGIAAVLEGFRPILIEREPGYIEDIRRRMDVCPEAAE